MSNFIIAIFESSLVIGALLFGVLGSMYFAYASVCLQITVEDPIPPPIANPLRMACRVLSLFIFIDALVAIGALLSTGIFSLGIVAILLSFTLALIILIMAIFSLIWAFIFIEKQPVYKSRISQKNKQSIPPPMQSQY